MNLFKAGAVFGGTTAIKILAGLLTVKIIAVYLGPDGFGYLGQFMSLVAFVAMLAGGGINVGVTRFTSQYRLDNARLHSYYCAAFVIWVASSFLLGFIFIVFADRISTLLFRTDEHRVVIAALGFAQVFTGAGNILLAIINGFKNVRGTATVTLATAVCSSLLTVGLVLADGVTGAMWALAVAPAVGFLFSLWVVRSQKYLSLNLRVRWLEIRQQVKDLGHYTLMLIASALTMPLAQILIRAMLEKSGGWASVGYWQGLIKLSDVYLQLITVLMASYYLPKLAESTKRENTHREVRAMFLYCLVFLVPTTLTIYLARKFITGFLFSAEFLPMADLFIIQLIGDALKVLSYVFTYLTVARSMTKIYVGAEIFQALCFTALTYLWVPTSGVSGAVHAYMTTYIIYFVMCSGMYTYYIRCNGRVTR